MFFTDKGVYFFEREYALYTDDQDVIYTENGKDFQWRKKDRNYTIWFDDINTVKVVIDILKENKQYDKKTINN